MKFPPEFDQQVDLKKVSRYCELNFAFVNFQKLHRNNILSLINTELNYSIFGYKVNLVDNV